MDITIYKPLDNSKVYLYFLVDNYSRAIMGWKASLSYSAQIAFENISEAYEKHKLGEMKYIELITDDGSENKGMVDVFILTKSNLKRIIAQCDIIFSNSMIESVNKRMKYDFLFRTKLLDYQQVVKYIPTAVEEYNNKPLSALYGLTPNEVLGGIIPDKNMFKEDIKQAARNRPAINSAMNCLNCKKGRL